MGDRVFFESRNLTLKLGIKLWHKTVFPDEILHVIWMFLHFVFELVLDMDKNILKSWYFMFRYLIALLPALRVLDINDKSNSNLRLTDEIALLWIKV